MTPAAVDPSVPPELSNNVFISTIDKFYNWGRKRSMWPMMFGLTCCAIEMICVAAGRYDLERFGAHPLNRGWMNVFRRWSASGAFHRYWPALRPGYCRR